MQQLQQNIFNVFTHITSFGERGRIGNGKRNIQQFGKRLCHVRFAATGWTKQQDVALLQFNIILASVRRLVLNASVVIEHCNGEHFLRLVLPNYVFIKECTYVTRDGKFFNANRWSLCELLVNDFVTEVNTFVADVHTRTSNELLYLLLRLCAERTLHQFCGVAKLCHE